ncbi:MAG: prephenate dehydratase [Syntrophomonadaceae bacterium]|jgi:prephenate dehydratase
MTCAVLGPKGSFSEEAALCYWKKRHDLVVTRSIIEVFAMVENGVVEAGMVPIENSRAGSIKATIDYLQESSLTIQGEINLFIEQDLMALKKYGLDEIELLISHPVALTQCERFIHQHLAGVRTEICASTSKAAQMLLKETRRTACIGNKHAAKLYGLEIIYPSIAGDNNITRFIHISRNKRKNAGNKNSIIFTLPDQAGALYKALGVFALENLNLSKIESFTGKNKRAGCNFYIEVDTPDNQDLQPLLEKLEQYCCYVKHLGSYQKAPIVQNVVSYA